MNENPHEFSMIETRCTERRSKTEHRKGAGVKEKPTRRRSARDTDQEGEREGERKKKKKQKETEQCIWKEN